MSSRPERRETAGMSERNINMSSPSSAGSQEGSRERGPAEVMAELLSPAEVARITGLSTATVRRKVDSGELPGERRNGQRMIPQRVILEFQQKRATRAPRDEDAERAASIFERFEHGASPAEVVIEMRVGPSEVERLFLTWKRLRASHRELQVAERREVTQARARLHAAQADAAPLMPLPDLLAPGAGLPQLRLSDYGTTAPKPKKPKKPDATDYTMHDPGSDAWHLALLAADRANGQADLTMTKDGSAIDDLADHKGLDEEEAQDQIRTWRAAMRSAT